MGLSSRRSSKYGYLSPSIGLGFTIVELLIVIVVIGVLSSVSAVAYNGIQNRAVTTAIQSELSMNAKKLEEYRILNGRYPEVGSSGATWFLELKDAGLRFTDYGEGHYVAYCVDNSLEIPDYALLIESKAGHYYKTNTQGSGEFTGTTAEIQDVCDQFSLPSYTNSARGWIRSYFGWAGESAW